MSGAPVAFGPFRLDPQQRVLWRGRALLPLPPKAVDVLIVLVSQAGRVVSKDDLLARVWPDTFVEEANLSVLVSQLRRTLGGARTAFIQTVPRRGYRFVAPTSAVELALGSLAILPFHVLGSEDAYLGLGLADAVITRLSRDSHLVVRPTAAVQHYLGRDRRPPGVLAGELQVDAVLDGRLQRQGERVRITAQLVRARDQETLWAQTLDGTLDDLFGLQDRLADALAQCLSAPHATPTRAPDPEAYRLCLEGRYCWNRLTAASLARARRAFESSLALDPGLAAAHAGLADTHTMLALFGLEPPEAAWTTARAAAERALELDPTAPEAWVSRGFVRLFQEWDWAGAAGDLERALEAQPSSSHALQWGALFHAMRGDFVAAAHRLQQAQAIDPVSLTVSVGVGFHSYLTEQHAPELASHHRTLGLDPDYALAHWALGLAHDARGDHQLAIPAHARAAALSGCPLVRSNLARSLALAGRRDEATLLLDQLASEGLSHYRRATVELALGDHASAVASLERACAARDHWLVWLKVDPMLQPLHDTPEVRTLLKRVGLG